MAQGGAFSEKGAFTDENDFYLNPIEMVSILKGFLASPSGL
jgi:hypothetical protein